MREIKFKGLTEDNEWVYGELITVKGKSFIKTDDEHERTQYGFMDSFTYVKSETVGQFTGLTDKNGKEIFEGDTCRLGSFDHKIAFDNGAFCDTKISNYNPTPINWTPLDDYDCISVQFASSHIDIIGNIHEK